MKKALALSAVIIAGILLPALMANLVIVVAGEVSPILGLIVAGVVCCALVFLFCLVQRLLDWYLDISPRTTALSACVPAMVLYPLALIVMISLFEGMGIALLVAMCLGCEIYNAISLGIMLSRVDNIRKPW